MTNTFMNKFNEISSLVSFLAKQGAVYKDKHFSVDQEARINLLSVCLGVDKGVDTFPITWITSDGKDLISIENEEEWREFFSAVYKAGRQVSNIEYALRSQLDACTTDEEIEALDVQSIYNLLIGNTGKVIQPEENVEENPETTEENIDNQNN